MNECGRLAVNIVQVYILHSRRHLWISNVKLLRYGLKYNFFEGGAGADPGFLKRGTILFLVLQAKKGVHEGVQLWAQC